MKSKKKDKYEEEEEQEEEEEEEVEEEKKVLYYFNWRITAPGYLQVTRTNSPLPQQWPKVSSADST